MSTALPQCLVLDHELLFCYYIKDILERKGVDVTVSNESNDAMYIIQEQDLDLLIIDMGFLDIEGSALIFQLKSKAPNLPIIAISTDVAKKEAALQAGASEFLQKPFDYLDLATKSMKLMGSTD